MKKTRSSESFYNIRHAEDLLYSTLIRWTSHCSPNWSSQPLWTSRSLVTCDKVNLLLMSTRCGSKHLCTFKITKLDQYLVDNHKGLLLGGIQFSPWFVVILKTKTHEFKPICELQILTILKLLFLDDKWNMILDWSWMYLHYAQGRTHRTSTSYWHAPLDVNFLLRHTGGDVTTWWLHVELQNTFSQPHWVQQL